MAKNIFWAARITLTDNGRLDLKEDGGTEALSIGTSGNVGIGTGNPTAKLDIDALCSIEQLSFDAVKHLQMLEPFGQGNPAPIFATKGVHRISPPRCVGVKGDHLQIAISDHTASVRCIGFGMGKLEKKILETESFSVAYEPQFNTYNGNTTVQFLLKDIQFE